MLYLLFTPADLLKAEQLGLFDMPTQVRAHTRKDGAVVAPHIRLQKKRLHPQGGQHDLFGHAEPRTEAHKLGRLGQFVHKHGGYRRLLSILAGLPEPQRDKLHESMAEVARKPVAMVREFLALGAKHEAPAKGGTALTGEEVAGEVSPHDAPSRGEVGPSEGDTKEENGHRYVLRDSRWHRINEESTDENTGPTQGDEEQGASAGAGGTADEVSGVPSEGGAGAEPESTEPAHDPVAHAEAKQDLADELLTNPDSERAAELARKVADGFKAGQLEKLRTKIEEMGGKAKVAEAIKHEIGKSGGLDAGGVKSRAVALVDGLATSLNLSRDEVLAELGLKEVRRKARATPQKPKNTLETGGDFSDDDPNSPNYRFRDTGYIGGSRKELAAQMIRQAGREGRQLRATDIDWQEIEQNPREAKELITKSNLFGAVDWDALKAGGMEPGAGFLVDRVYASLAPEPPEDSAQARRDYAVGLESLRTRLEACKTPDEVTDALNTLRDEYEGAILNAQEAADYQKAQGIYRGIADRRWALSKERDALVQAMINPGHEASALGYKQQRRLDKGWKADPALEGQIRQLKAAAEQARADLEEWDARHPEVAKGRTDSPMAQAVGQAYGVMRSIVEKAKARNQEENPVHRAWKLMGPRFLGILNYRRREGSDAFREHLAAAKIGKIEDWSWAEKERKTVDAPKATKGQVRFQLQVAETFERKGGQPVKVASTAALKAMFGLRDVQSGNWVLSDPAAAAFHVQKSAEALSDLADLLDVEPGQIAMNGRVALAFGARGRGAAGGMAARAHYEPVHRTINLTKLGGGGSLGHELFHAIDNLIGEVETGQASSKDVYASEDPALLPEGELRDAMIAFRRAMLDGPHRLGEKIRYTDKDVKTARYNIDRSITRGVAGIIKAAGDIHAAVRAVDAHFAGRTDKMSEKNRKDWRKMAAAYYDAKPAGGEALVESGPTLSAFAFEASKLDSDDHGKYWSKPREMAARAFQAWCEDRLAGQGRRNDYLSSMADNRYYRLLDQKPFPEGEERDRINMALDGLVVALRKAGTLAKAFGLLKAA
ncbi:hypothetical protein SAMN02949497_1201 [Methylomagnum ishizawai]|uniref:Large polyvalent protein-associated domain-containing protein n=1 Tax=Methylomagnum ishizawai TaxID=1760988 RepID=A0A1Y6D1P3_9GAMM|nr:LPD1 domain-containing protein [Methylomagnum ishizawai]SMF93905.1 hypothetical protein SAMN02949497_1201 [Methylomagnum ishizawai]